MKAEIFITGGISGNRIIANKLSGSTGIRNGRFNALIVEFDSIVEARKSLSTASKELREEAYFEGSQTFPSHSREAGILSWDASTAKILIK